MHRPKRSVWISATILAGALQATVPTEAFAQPPALTRELDSPIRGDRYAQSFSISFGTSDFQAFRMIVPALPAGKRLFLQSVSIQMALTHGQSPYMAAVALFEGLGRNGLASLFVDMDLQAAELQGAVWSRQRYFTGNRDINMVVNKGESLSVTFSRNGRDGLPRLNVCQVTLIGYFVDMDPQTPPAP